MLHSKFPKGKLREELIVEATLEVYIKEGYSALALSTIARQAKISASHLKYYFPDIDDLIEAMLKELLRRYKSLFQDNALKYMDIEPPEKVLDRLINSHFDMIKKGENALIFAEDVAFAERNELCRQYLDSWVDWYTGVVSKLIRAINPDTSHNKSYRTAAIIIVLLDNMQRFLGEGKTKKTRFRGLEKDVRLLINNLVYASD